MTTDTEFDWGRHPVPGEGEGCLRLGPLEVRFQRRAGELRMRWHREGEELEDPVRWSRWAPGEAWQGEIDLVPTLPDRLVVVKPDEEFRLMPEARARIYLRVPLHVEVVAASTTEAALATVPTLVMSDTWWGAPGEEEGELGYWLPTRARRQMLDEEFEEHLCICPIQLENRAGEPLHVEKIALRVDYLTIFRQGTRLWADETRVRYLGDEEGSRIDVAGVAPREAADANLLTPARERMARGLTARTFARLRTSFGGWL